MSKLQKRRILSFFIDASAIFLLWILGAGGWALLVTPLSIWSFYDGMTRCELRKDI